MRRVRGFKLSKGLAPLTPTLSHSKSDISDFEHLRLPNSGKPEFGWGEGARRVSGAASTSNDPALLRLVGLTAVSGLRVSGLRVGGFGVGRLGVRVLGLDHADPTLLGSMWGDKSNSSVFDNSQVRSLVPDFVATMCDVTELVMGPELGHVLRVVYAKEGAR